jgi:2-polyprenyl-6-hydroxyphenyl methylase/3-demethylubiquinone-9 3-methyltransferase
MNSVASDDVKQRRVATFSFGRNWKSYSRFVSEASVKGAEQDISDWLGPDAVKGKSVVDIGCGSGIHSLCFHRLGAQRLLSLDVDPYSVECADRFRREAGEPATWQVLHSSILDNAVREIGAFDIVYSWGVLHHTGQMWAAIDNASRLAKPQNSRLWISLYAKGPTYPRHLKIKTLYNRGPWLLKHAMVTAFLLRRWYRSHKHGKKLRDWFWHGRGMNAYHDAVDWLGGLPYEVASVEEVKTFLAERGWILERVHEVPEGQCSVYLFRRP